MPLTPGTRLGPYEIVGQIGAGGMGEVWKARDPKLDRFVAVKVLPADIAADQDRLQRFQQEAKALAALNHPNLVQVHEAGEHEDTSYLVMELLEGETLREKLGGKPLAPKRAAEIAREAALGLSAAHEKGILHRDLKPENLFLTKDGRVKLLDFGLAKFNPTSRIGQESVTRAFLSEPGTVVGTTGYMSPEQVRGEVVDARSDLFSLGVILWEMVTGARPFQGDSSVEVMHAILKEDPPELDESLKVPPMLERVLHGCLAKEPSARIHSAHDLAFALEGLRGSSSGSGARAVAAPKGWRARVVRPGVVLALGGGLLLAAGELAWRLLHPPKPALLPSYLQVTHRSGDIGQARFTKDGEKVVYGARWEGGSVQVFRTDLGTLQETPVSPPGTRLYTLVGNDEALVGRVKPDGTGPATLARMLNLGITAPKEILENVSAADQAPDGGLAVVRRNTDGRDQLECPPGKVLFQSTGSLVKPRFSPDGRRLAFLHVLDRAGRGSELMSVELASGTAHSVRGDPRLSGFAWAGPDLWYSADDSLWALRNGSEDSKARQRLLRVPGQAELLDVARDGRVLLKRSHFDLGVLLQRELPAPVLLSQRGGSFFLGLAEDGSALFQENRLPDDRANGIYLSPAGSGTPVFVGNYAAGSLSPDGKWVLASARGGTWHLVPVGSGEPRVIPSLGLERRVRLQWLGPDRILLSGNEPGKAQRMYVQDLGKGTLTAITGEGIYQTIWHFAVSPDRSKALAVSEGGHVSVNLVSPGTPRPVAGLGADDHVGGWCDDSRSLFVIRGRWFPVEVFRVDPESGKRIPFRTLNPHGFQGAAISHLFFTPDGRTWGCSFHRTPAELWVVEGLK